MINLKIDPEFQSQIPPLIVWGNTLVDGHNRYEIVQKHPEISFSTMPLRLKAEKKSSHGSARISWGGASYSHYSGINYSALEVAVRRIQQDFDF